MFKSIAAAAIAVLFITSTAASAQTVFTYQGTLDDAGAPADGLYDLRFRIWDDLTPGAPDTQITGILTLPAVTVTDGLFTVDLDFGDAAFTGEGDRFFQIDVRSVGAPTYTTLNPRQSIAATPRAISALSTSNLELPFYGEATTTKFNTALYIDNNSPSGYAIKGDGHSAGILGTASFPVGSHPGFLSGAGVVGISSIAGVHGTTDIGIGVVGYSNEGHGAHFRTRSDSIFKYGVRAESTRGASAGLFEVNDTSGIARPALIAKTDSRDTGAIALYGVIEATSPGGNSTAVRGENHGTGPFGIGVWGSQNGSGWGIYGTCGSGGLAGRFDGDVSVIGTLSKSGGSFKIDHPQDPENMFLSHSFVESPDMKNIYDGVVMLNNQGQAIVTLPSYFNALNQDFRYQLTTIGAYAPVYILSKIESSRDANAFIIAGGSPNLEVSWQVTGIRHDAWANQNRIPIEEYKSESQKGKFLNPESFNQPKELGIGYQNQN